MQNDLTFLLGLRRRVRLAGNGPRGLAVIGSTALVAEYFSDSIGAVDIGSGAQSPARSLPLGPREPLTDVRRGEMLFHDATLCFQQWQSCATCHPGAARVDGLNWDLLNDGIGSPRSAKSLLLVHQTPPAMAMGVRANAQAAVRAGIKSVLLAARPDEDAAAMDEYLKSLKPVPSPHLVNGELSPAARRGRKVFEESGCARCHPLPLYTDLRSYDVGTGQGSEENSKLDTPTLVEVWRTAPYLHDGRAVTLEEVLTRHNPDDRHGVTSGLTAEQISDLAEFVLSQ
jgi:cytochrome c peroxidase